MSDSEGTNEKRDVEQVNIMNLVIKLIFSLTVSAALMIIFLMIPVSVSNENFNLTDNITEVFSYIIENKIYFSLGLVFLSVYTYKMITVLQVNFKLKHGETIELYRSKNYSQSMVVKQKLNSTLKNIKVDLDKKENEGVVIALKEEYENVREKVNEILSHYV